MSIHKAIYYKKLVFEIIGAAMEVHRELNWGLLEAVYSEALHMELTNRCIQNEVEKPLHCFYKNYELKKFYVMDIVVEDIIIELKSVDKLSSAHRAQLFNYMRLTKKPIGLLINFGQPSLQCERYAYIEKDNECILLDKNMDSVY